MSISPSDWGPQYWRMMHSIAFWYPTDPTEHQKQSAHAFYSSLQQLLPCSACRDHYARILAAHPLERAIQSRMELVKWVIDVHNDVNESTGKARLAFDEAVLRARLSESTAATTTQRRDWTFATLGALAVGVALAVFGKHRAAGKDSMAF